MNKIIKNMLIGVFVVAAIAVLISVILFLKPSVGDGKQVMRVRFSDINNINVGTRVLFAGKPIGEVVALQEIENAREEPMDETGRVYFFELVLQIDSGVKVYNTDEISIQTSGLLGEKSIAIIPKSPPKGVSPKRITDQPIYANSVDTFQNMLLDISDLASTMEETFRQASNWVVTHGDDLAHSIHSAGSAMDGIHQAVADYNATGLIHDVHRGVHEFNNTLNEITQGKGTVGKLVGNDDLYLQTNAILTKINNLMNDINNYGLVFHLNKQWQRSRLQKATFLDALESPQSFQAYFQNEVDDINAAMGRLSMVVQRAAESPERETILYSQHFKQNFDHLLRRVEELSNNLRLYNQQLSETVGGQ